jgi:hypothetical protein
VTPQQAGRPRVVSPFPKATTQKPARNANESDSTPSFCDEQVTRLAAALRAAGIEPETRDEQLVGSAAANAPERASVIADHDLRIEWSERIRSAWQKSVESILETNLPHGGFEMMTLPFSARMAQQLMRIAGKPALANPNHGSLLPASWTVLRELSRLDDDELDVAFEKRLIEPRLERKDVPGIRAEVRRALGRRVTERAKEIVHRSFFAELRTEVGPELAARLEALSPAVKEQIIEVVISILVAQTKSTLPGLGGR